MARNTIINKGDGVQYEMPASAAIEPGMALQRLATGEVSPHPGGQKSHLYAVEFPELGKGINHTYTAGEDVKILSPQRGAELELLIAPGTNVDRAFPLVSNGDGTITGSAVDGTTGEPTAAYGDIIGYAAYDLAVPAGAAERHTVRVI